ncbi:sulfatase [Verrucomicrobiaceae bacterium R5-34]|uniref:Sulfatase n=1 Tax=Oceaniferula flava TaxID=2800421 RepID=A0AAE2SBL4_9BACT|nr:sulfatase [Oceaniferula flavus]MBK1829926.1 sulfatase [Verrucomicrobiaceae bacterium R5-34]MBK1855226.1 sulfatase [Oceaniferula flavus]MBM1136532.1 sulfatase [Oceaniferula flavus]
MKSAIIQRALCGLLAITSISPVVAAEPSKKPNIIFIYADDMGWTGTSVAMIQGDASSKSDYYQTPQLEKLAARGMVFSQAYSPSALCTPSRAAVLTGLTPAQLHITTPGRGKNDGSKKLITPEPTTRLSDSQPTIGSVLKEQGYATALLGKWHIGRNDDAGDYGFDLHDGNTQNESKGTDEDPKEIDSLTRRGIEFMRKNVAAGKPFYLQISHYAVHEPTQSKPASIDKFKSLPAGQFHREADYAGMTWDLDASLARISQAIEQLKIADQTYLVFMSDNGTRGNPRTPNNAPLQGGKGTLYEGGIRVPLIVLGPDVQTGYCRQSVSGTDLFSTFAAWSGSRKTTAESVDLTPLLTGHEEDFQRTKGLLFHYPHYGHGPQQVPQTALIDGDWKLLRDWESGSNRLYHLKEDLGESKNLAGNELQKFHSMVRAMEARLTETMAQRPEENTNYDPTAEPKQSRQGNRRGGRR